MTVYSLDPRRWCMALLLAMPLSMAMAQDYHIDWYVVAGGGGESATNDPQLTEIRLRGTIGQATLGRASGGNFQLDSGYWVLFPATTTPPVTTPTPHIFSNGFED